uniref:RNA helicase n=1 Tax=Onchocerca volvulus TaxID=6282 RepID=A0A2K6W1T3_ONCVO
MNGNFSFAMDVGEIIRTLDVEADVPDFSSLMLNRTSLNALTKAGFTKPSPVQARAIPFGMLGFDLLVQAKSGTGKTMVFALLAVENLNAQIGRSQVLIVAPTREIASQIVSYIRMLAPPVIHVGMFVGGNEKGIAEDIQKLKKSIHIVVGTTGRLCHLVRINVLRLSYIRLFILDEADKLMEDNFQKEINYLFSALPPEKQVAVFSATYPYQLDATLTQYMRDVHLVRIDTDAQLLGIKQYVIVARNETRKMNILLRLLLRLRYGQCIIFVNDHKKCDELCVNLQQARFDVVCISGNMPQTERTKAMRQLKNCMVKLLVSTDLTARGIDAPGVNVVINYGSPLTLATYLHRIGRAGRFGTHGAAFTILNSDKELKLFSDFTVEGKLRAKLLRIREDWPSNLIYDDEFFSSSEDFRPYMTRNWRGQQDHNDEEDEVYEFMKIGSNSLQEFGGTPKLYEDKIVLHQKSKKRIYSNQDFHDIFGSMKNNEIPEMLLKKLIALKIRSPYDLDLTRKNTLMTLRLDTINKNSEDISSRERSCHEKSFYLLNNEANFTMNMDINMRESKENMYEAKPTGSPTNYADISNSKELEFVNFDRLLLENLPKYKSDSESPVERLDEKYMRESSLAGSSDLQELNPGLDESIEWKKKDTKYETCKELRTKLTKIKSRFNYELVLGMDRIRECITTTGEPEIRSVATQTEAEEKPTATRSAQTDGLSFFADSNFAHSNEHPSSQGCVEREMNHFAKYIKYMRQFNF